ncbi:uncharacterized protein LOC128236307 [Mya arenaria]|uniref:uncharacterized protein LOC128236307 n=1 Tax=Mya arenaria TaxID=6604 RepID=UPI0022DFDC62|nr:uncharacterized protein LOC128236307 [Mya arenaria]
MALAKSILKAISSCNLTGVANNIEDVLKGDVTALDNKVLQNHISCIQTWMHALVSHLASVCEKRRLAQALEISVTCSKYYTKYMDHVPPDKASLVPQLLCKIVEGVAQSKEHIVATLKLSEDLIVMLEHYNVYRKFESGSSFLFACLWNASVALFKSGCSENDFLNELQLRKCAVTFLMQCYGEHSKALEKVSRVTAFYHKNVKEHPEWATTSSIEIVVDFFEDLFYTAKRSIADSAGIEEEQDEIRVSALGLEVNFVDFCLKVSEVERAENMISNQSEKFNHSLMPLLTRVLKLYVSLHKLGENSSSSSDCKLGLDLENLGTEIGQFAKEKRLFEEEYVLALCLTQIVQNCGRKVSKRFASDLTGIKDLTYFIKQAQCVVGNCVEHFERIGQADKADDDMVSKLQTWSCQLYFRRLQMLMTLTLATEKSKEEGEASQEFLKTFWLFEESLNKYKMLPASYINSYRQNIAECLMAPMANHASVYNQYSNQAIYCKISVNQMGKCGKKASLQMYEMQVLATEKGRKWLEGSTLAVETLMAYPAGLTTVTYCWAKLKLSAISLEQDEFRMTTFLSAVKSVHESLPGSLTEKDVLFAEYRNLLQGTKRNFEAEFYVLSECLDIELLDNERAEVLIEVAESMLVNGTSYKDRSVEDIAEEAKMLIGESPTAEMSLLLGHYYFIKYLLQHNADINDKTKQVKLDVGVEGVSMFNSNREMRELVPLSTQEKYLANITKALELWEQGANHWASTQAVSKYLQQHWEVILQCGIRLNLLLQPELAVRTMRVAQGIACQQKLKKGVTETTIHLASSLILQGQYAEPHDILFGRGLDEANKQLLLVRAQYFMYTGQREKAVQSLEGYLKGDQSVGTTATLFDGIARRLLSMCLCFCVNSITAKTNGVNSDGAKTDGVKSDIRSSDGTKLDGVNSDGLKLGKVQGVDGSNTACHLLSLAYEGMHQHLSVCDWVLKGHKDKKMDLWYFQYELVLSLYHLCQLFRMVGMPRDAFCFLSIGVRLTAHLCLPAWCCLFLAEKLQVHGMEANFSKAMTVLDPMFRVFDINTDFSSLVNEAEDEGKTADETEKKVENTSKTPANKNGAQNQGKKDKRTPERIGHCTELSLEIKEKLEKLQPPDCSCLKEVDKKNHLCCSAVEHRLCIISGVTLADFMKQAGLPQKSASILNHLNNSYDIFRKGPYLNAKPFLEKEEDTRQGILNGRGFKKDQELFSSCLTATCIMAELHLNSKDFSAVNSLWKMTQELDKQGFLTNVLHGTVLLSRLALCEASSVLLSQVRNSQVQNSKLQTNLESMMTDIEPLSSKKTLFNEPVEVDDVDEAKEDNDTATADKATLQKKVMFDDAAKKVEDEIKSEKKDSASVKADIGKTTAAKVKATPLKQKKVADVLATPKVYSQLVNVFASTKKVKPAASSIAQTPATRIRDLNELIASDDEEDVFFPKKRPITPSVSKSLKAKTEPRNRTIKSEKSTLQGTKANLACKLNFIYQDDDGNESEKQETKDSKRKFFKSKHTIHEEKEHEEDKEITEVSENIQDEFTVKKDVYDIKLELFKDIKTSQQTVKPAKQPSKGRKGVKKSVNKSAQEAVSIIISSPDADPSEVVATDTNSEEKVTTSNTQNENSIKDKSKIEIDVYDIETELSPAVKQNQKSVKSVKGSARAGKRTVKKKETVKETKGLVDSDTSISCETGSNKGSTKKTKVTKKAAAKETISQSEQKKADKENKDTLNVPEAVSEKKKVVKPVKRVTRSARSRKTEEPESVRMLNPGAELGKGNLELRTLDAESDVDHQDAKSNGDSYIDLCIEGEEELLDDICLPNIGNEIGLSPVEIIRSHVHGGGRIDMSLEPGKDIAHECDEIESMRSDVKSGGKAARGTLAKAKKDTVIRKSDRKSKDKVNSNKKVGADNQHDVEDDIGEDSSRESMRSGRLCSTQGMMEKLGFMELLDEGANAEPCVANEGETSAEIFSTLEFLYNQMSCRPPSPQHADLCNLLAYHHFERDTVKAAFYLSDGLAVTFRHQLLLNQTKKMRRVKYNENDGEVKFPPSMSFSAFFNQRSDSVETMISSIPSEWSVVQVSVVSAGLSWKQMVVTRFTRDNKPLVLKLPAFNTKKGSQVVEDFIKIKQSVHMLWGEKDRDKWWKKRFQFDEQLKSLVSCMENLWFDHWRCVLAPREHSTATLELVQSELKAIVGSVVDTSIIEFLLLAAKHLVKGELEKCCLKLIPSVDIVINGTISILKKHKTSTSSVNPHLVLILDKTVQQLPWETLPLLNKMSITRMPCLSYLHSQLSYLQSLESSVYSRGINMRNTSYFLNPGADLKNCETTFEKWFEGEKGWVGVSGKPPTEAQFVEAITSKDMLLYIGHGSGGQYLGYDEIEKLTGQALVVLMGCSSGQLQAKGQLEPAGMMISYFLAGCPCMMGNLFDVTDKDIDKFTEEFLKLCMAAKPGTYIPLLMQKAREVFKMKYINGCAPIMYGLPMFISKN